jgi:hypothetical protein
VFPRTIDLGHDDPGLCRRGLHGVSAAIALRACGLTNGNHRHLHELLAGFGKLETHEPERNASIAWAIKMPMLRRIKVPATAEYIATSQADL